MTLRSHKEFGVPDSQTTRPPDPQLAKPFAGSLKAIILGKFQIHWLIGVL